MILIATNREDLTADLVILRLQERDQPYVRFNTEDLPQRALLTIEPGRETRATLELPKGAFRTTDISAVWYRRPVAPVPAAEIESPEARQFARDESEAALANFWTLLRCLWVSPLAELRRAEHKLHQLGMAAELGFEVPKTMATSDPDQAREFSRTFPAGVVVKSLGRGFVNAEDGEQLVVFTERVKPDPLLMERVRWAPTLLQEEIRRAFDLRVTVVGTSVFGAEIHRRPGAPGIDWRKDPPEDLVHRPHQLPSAFEARIVALVRRMGLRFGALDFIVRPDGGYTFLELNPNGQWAWLELELAAPISDALADLLLKGEQ